MDKRFWGGAIAVLTVVVAGAGTLPGLLLRPAVEELPVAGTVEPAPFIAKPKLAEAEPARPAVSPAPGVVAEPTPPVAEAPKPAAQAPQPVTQAPQPATQAPQPAPAEANKISFPPVQPVGIATRPDLDAVPTSSAAAAPTQSHDASARPAREAAEKPARRIATRDTGKRKRAIRPAIYPMREFLAWRR
jgi:hypothetical protein